MSTEYIKAVYVRHDGVYLHSKSSNDDRPFRIWKCDGLTDVYQNDGQTGLDREMVRMFSEYAAINGDHPSVERYCPCLRDGAALREAFNESIQQEYIKLTSEDIASVWFTEGRQTAGARAYKDFRRNAENDLYTKLAQFAAGLPDKQPPVKYAGAR